MMGILRMLRPEAGPRPFDPYASDQDASEAFSLERSARSTTPVS
jgi:hypothetical protein